MPRPPQERANTRAELADRERLGDVVVGAELETDHLVELVVAGGQHDDRDGAPRAQLLAYLEPVQLRQHDVEHDEVDRLVAEACERLLAVGCLHDDVTVALEREGQHLAHCFLVVDEKNCRGLGHRFPCCLHVR